MENFEKGPERILTRDQVLERISALSENHEIRRELYDQKGIYLVEAVIPGEKEGETVEYMYIRKGEFVSKHKEAKTTIYKTYFDKDGMPQSGETIATYDEETGVWENA